MVTRSAKTAINGGVISPDCGYLYKYRSLANGKDRDNTLSIITGNQLWWGRGSSFNDPFDCSHHIDFERSDEEWAELIGRGIQSGRNFLRNKVLDTRARLGSARVPLERVPEPATATGYEVRVTDSSGNPVSLAEVVNRSRARTLKKNLARLDKLFGVLCLSQEPDNILLWSHYANSHRGICLQFDVGGHPNAFPRLHPVTYRTEALDLAAPIQDMFSMLQRDPKLLLDVASLMRSEAGDDDNPARKIEQWFYTKSVNWAYEREWRALTTKPGLNRFPARALTGIIVGCVDSDENLALVREATRKKRPRPKLYVAVKKRYEFGLEIVAAG